MAYIGTDINYGNIASMTGVGNGTTTPIATLDYSVPTSASIIVTLDGVTQVPVTNYVASGTTLTFDSAVASPIAILVVFLGRSLDIGTPADNTVTNAKMANNSVDSAELVAGSVDLAHLSATGTPTASLALKGDYSWGTAGGPSLGSGNEYVRTNSNQINQNITVPSGTNASSIGPVTVGSSYSVTVNGVYTVI
jgi:hypothetical protein